MTCGMMEEVNRRLFLKIERPILQNQDIDVKAVKRSIGKQNACKYTSIKCKSFYK